MADLSPAAQAVLDAADDVYWDWSDMSPATSRVIAAAALRAAADQVVPSNPYSPGWDDKDEIRYQFLAIADELEGVTSQ